MSKSHGRGEENGVMDTWYKVRCTGEGKEKRKVMWVGNCETSCQRAVQIVEDVGNV